MYSNVYMIPGCPWKILNNNSCVLFSQEAAPSVSAGMSSVVIAAVQVVMTVIASLLMDRAGRKLLLAVSAFAMGCSLGEESFVFVAVDETKTKRLEDIYFLKYLPCLQSLWAARSVRNLFHSDSMVI